MLSRVARHGPNATQTYRNVTRASFVEPSRIGRVTAVQPPLAYTGFRCTDQGARADACVQGTAEDARRPRAHRVPKYPDPRVNPNGGSEMTMGADVNPKSPQFKAAQEACQKLVPNSPLSAGPAEAGN